MTLVCAALVLALAPGMRWLPRWLARAVEVGGLLALCSLLMVLGPLGVEAWETGLRDDTAARALLGLAFVAAAGSALLGDVVRPVHRLGGLALLSAAGHPALALAGLAFAAGRPCPAQRLGLALAALAQAAGLLASSAPPSALPPGPALAWVAGAAVALGGRVAFTEHRAWEERLLPAGLVVVLGQAGPVPGLPLLAAGVGALGLGRSLVGGRDGTALLGAGAVLLAASPGDGASLALAGLVAVATAIDRGAPSALPPRASCLRAVAALGVALWPGAGPTAVTVACGWLVGEAMLAWQRPPGWRRLDLLSAALLLASGPALDGLAHRLRASTWSPATPSLDVSMDPPTLPEEPPESPAG